MKFVKETNHNNLTIPAAAMKLSGFDDGVSPELHALPGAVIILQSKMTAMDMIHTMESLLTLHDELLSHLCLQCGFCEGCEDECPVDLDCATDPVTLPDSVREAAGIPEGAKLGVCVDDEDGTVTIYKADYDHDLSDVPPHILELLACGGVCLGELEEYLLGDEIIYGV